MAVGDTHKINNGTLEVTLTEDATYGVVLTSIENLLDGVTQSFVAASLFEVVLRKVQVTDSYYTLDASNKTSVVIHGEEYSGDPISPGNLLVGETVDAAELDRGFQPLRGLRRFFHADFHYININGTTDDATVHVYVNLLDDQPDRVLFSLILDQTQNTGSRTMSDYAFFWAAPAILTMTPYTSDHYLNGMNGGLATRNPRTDLVGNGTTYRFNVGKKAGTQADELYPAVGFEPEAKASQYADRMELMYPTWMSMALSAYGNRATAGQTVYMHDELRFRGRKVTDWYDGTNIILHHAVLVENPLVVANDWGDDVQWRADTYVAVFKRTGDVLGEDVGLHYQKWATSSPEGRAILPDKAKDRGDMGLDIQGSPIFRPYFTGDDEYETGVTELIAAEFRLAFPALADIASHPLHRNNYDLLYEYNNNSSGTLPGNVGNTNADLFALAMDAGKKTYAEELLADYGLWTYGAIVCRRPTPFDGQGFFVTDGMSAGRVRNHHEALDASYKSVDDWLKVTRTIAAVSFSGGFTKITLSAGALDSSIWNFVNVYTGTTGGIDHSTHPNHLGWCQKDDASWAFPIEKQSQANFTANPPIIWVAGDRTGGANPVTVGETINLHFTQPQYLPGYDVNGDGQVYGNATTSMCSWADEIGNLAATTGGWATRYIEEFISENVPYLHGVIHVLPRLNQICFHSHNGEVPASSNQINGWRRVLAQLRSEVFSQTPTVDGVVMDCWMFQIYEEDGPYDWLIGRVDGHTRVCRRLDLTTTRGSWGQSPLFQTVWGRWYRFGGHLANREGHITNYLGSDVYEQFFIEESEAVKYREAMTGDFMVGRLPSFGIYPELDGTLGTRPDGVPAYTPFYHATAGMTVEGSYANLFARLVQFELNFAMVNVNGQRVRSLQRTSTGVATSTFLNDIAAHDAWHAIGSDELGTSRAPLFHNVMRDHRNPRKFIAIFANDHVARRASTYLFDPALYQDQLPMGGDGYTVTAYTCNHDGVVEGDRIRAVGQRRFAISLEASEVKVLVFDFSSGLKFTYAYGDEELREVDIPSDQVLVRVEDIHGSGPKLIVGVRDELPDDDWKIASIDMRIFPTGKSETK